MPVKITAPWSIPSGLSWFSLKFTAGNFNIDERFVKKGYIIVALKDNQNIIAEFAGKLGKREIAQGVLGSDSLIITLDDIKNIFIDIKIP